jgi:hypothetical protein
MKISLVAPELQKPVKRASVPLPMGSTFEGTEDDGVSEGYRAYLLDQGSAAALWRKSEELVGERY